ncbi:hypothetical protein [Streptomyces sp. NPDC050504]|uniref:hypothetical protein n=1 Tax=Streptomyces sp. NPDC050504 TaxID=3365618 RepID=UPI0037B2F4D1
MPPRPRQTEPPFPTEFPLNELLDRTDWASLATAGGTGESLPAALTLLTSSDPVARETGLRTALGSVTHQNSIYEATVPVALFVAAILDHPAVTAGDSGHGAPTPSTLVRLLDWLGDTAADADDEFSATDEHLDSEVCRAEIRAFREAKPAIFPKVQALLGHDSTDVRHAALIAVIPLVEHPFLTQHQAEIVGHARRLLAASTDRHHRNRALDALKGWGYNTGELENASDIAARERYARLQAARASWDGNWAGGGYSEEPPF